METAVAQGSSMETYRGAANTCTGTQKSTEGTSMESWTEGPTPFYDTLNKGYSLSLSLSLQIPFVTAPILIITSRLMHEVINCFAAGYALFTPIAIFCTGQQR